MNARLSRARCGFTLPEMLIAFLIVSVLAALLLGAFSRTREQAGSVACVNQLRQIGVAVQLYLGENRLRYFQQGQAGSQMNWIRSIFPYANDDKRLFKCRADQANPLHERTYRFNATVGSSGPSATATLFGKTTAQIVSPPRTITVFCVAYSGSAAMPIFKVDTETWRKETDENPALKAAYPRLHSEGAVNVLFADGRSGTLRYPIEDAIYYWDR